MCSQLTSSMTSMTPFSKCLKLNMFTPNRSPTKVQCIQSMAMQRSYPTGRKRLARERSRAVPNLNARFHPGLHGVGSGFSSSRPTADGVTGFSSSSWLGLPSDPLVRPTHWPFVSGFAKATWLAVVRSARRVKVFGVVQIACHLDQASSPWAC